MLYYLFPPKSMLKHSGDVQKQNYSNSSNYNSNCALIVQNCLAFPLLLGRFPTQNGQFCSRVTKQSFPFYFALKIRVKPAEKKNLDPGEFPTLSTCLFAAVNYSQTVFPKKYSKIQACTIFPLKWNPR